MKSKKLRVASRRNKDRTELCAYSQMKKMRSTVMSPAVMPVTCLLPGSVGLYAAVCFTADWTFVFHVFVEGMARRELMSARFGDFFASGAAVRGKSAPFFGS